jgi:nicotinamide-nucleotide amidase
MNHVANEHALALSQFLIEHHLLISTAESCTGGMVSSALTDLAGSSNWFDRGFVTYSNQAKVDSLGVQMDLIQNHGAVSEEVAREMAIGTITHSKANIGLSITGVAGPTGSSLEKPVGFVCFGWAWKRNGVIESHTQGVHLLGSDISITDSTRHVVRTLARDYSLKELLNLLRKI